MKNRIYVLLTLIALVSVATVDSASAQRSRGHWGGGGGGRIAFGGGGGRIAVGGGARIGVGIGAAIVGPRIYAGGYYRSPYYAHYPRPYYRPYRYYGMPIGFVVNVLPYGFLSFNTAWGPYYYSDGYFYQSYVAEGTQREQYQVVDPPLGVVIPGLPNGVNTVVIDGNTYYEKNGTYYQEILQDKQVKYVVVGKNGQLDTGKAQDEQPAPAPEPEILQQLPNGCRGVEINGQQLYVSPDGMYYQEVTNADSSRGYKVVGKLSADN
ncbi:MULTISPECIES: DUF6515 family protein [unclassified Chitinophaga]|uniref:DUF6515 family protein n=1 Tax=unclassified Chitinophaga TaxID=2619133 RepID=UPI0009CA7909|nr:MULTISPECIES: DUF6515 family protein [unclassified Chitinophaga]OMP76078.1 hypothetical protein BW716_26905 [[Flexibacter] sp. ATCC 35208]WPV69363.1 hypothetical protein QQL36_11685 [Chitinophaga sp. LS1]